MIWKPDDIEFIFSSYFSMEDRLRGLLKIFPYSEENEKSWSPEIVSLFLDICGTIDSLSRQILSEGLEKDSVEVQGENGQKRFKEIKDLNIIDFELNLFNKMNLLDSRVVVYIYSLFPNCIIVPYENYRDSNGGWWFVYNKLKHNRLSYYRLANLGNVIRSLSALLLFLSRFNDESFTLALVRHRLIISDTVPEFVHWDRGQKSLIWIESELFCVPNSHESITSNDIDDLMVFNSSKLSKFVGRLNSIK